jgi:hypothetical protein
MEKGIDCTMLRKTSRHGAGSGIATLILAAMIASPSHEVMAQGIPVTINGEGWTQAGFIGHSSDTLDLNYNGNWFQSVRGHITARAEISKNWEGTIGIGVRTIQKGFTGKEVAMADPGSAARMQVGVEPYIAQARFTYTYGEKGSSPLALTFGYFPFKYNEEVKDLGLYLLRGTVYPAFLFSGFESDETIGIANLLGLNLHSDLGHFSHDILLSSETKIRPLFDYSLAYIGKYKPNPAFEIGAGVNFYRLLPINGDLTTPRDPTVFTEADGAAIGNYDRRYYALDSIGGGQVDTIRFTFKGIKVSAFGTWDLKVLTGTGAMGPEDLKVYGEVAIIGTKNYKVVYDDISQRIPMMVGFNLPVFNFLDHLSLEMEYYKSPYRNDYQKLEKDYSPIPVSNNNVGRNVATDPVTGEKTIQANGKIYPNEDPKTCIRMISNGPCTAPRPLKSTSVSAVSSPMTISVRGEHFSSTSIIRRSRP